MLTRRPVPLVVLLSGCLAWSLAGCSRQSVSIGAGGVAASPEARADQPARPDGGGFRFPADQGGELLSRLLPPTDQPATLAEGISSGPRRFPVPAWLEQPVLPLPLVEAVPPRLPLPVASRPARPGPLAEDFPLEGGLSSPLPPEPPVLPAGPRVRLPSADVNQPPPVPVLAQPLPDRAPLDDPTADASGVAALSARLPARAAPAPFLRLTLPDPFENRLSVASGTQPAEDASPAARPPRTPDKP